jgi:hypothetical protein
MAPSVKLTVPSGMPVCELTVAVSVTFAPKVAGLGKEVRETLVAVTFTVWMSTVEVLGVKLASPS